MSSSVLETWDYLPNSSVQSSEPLFKVPSPFWSQEVISRKPRPKRETAPRVVGDAFDLFHHRHGSHTNPWVIEPNQINSPSDITSRYHPSPSQLFPTNPSFAHRTLDRRYFQQDLGYRYMRLGKLYSPESHHASYFHQERNSPMDKVIQNESLRYVRDHELQSHRVFSKRYIKTNPLSSSLLHAARSYPHQKVSFNETLKCRCENETGKELPLLFWREDAESQNHQTNSRAFIKSRPLWRFVEGSLVELEGGRLKCVEDIRTEDLEQCAQLHPGLMMKRFTVIEIKASSTPEFSCLQVEMEQDGLQLSLEVSDGMPFFVSGQGWFSCNPWKTSQTCGLHCHQLKVGDLCLALTRAPANQSFAKVSEDIQECTSHKDEKLPTKHQSRRRHSTAPERIQSSAQSG